MFFVCIFILIKAFGLPQDCLSFLIHLITYTSYYVCLCNSKFLVLNVLSLSLMPSSSVDGSLEHLSGFGLLLPVYQLNSFRKFWKPSSPKKSKEPGDELWEVPRWMRSSTSRTMNSSGISRFQPAARMLYHLALSEHSWASCRFPCVFWSLACIDAFKDTSWCDKQVSRLHDNV